MANQSEAPEWLTKRVYLAFEALRAYPLQQWSKLALALRDRMLALNQSSV